MSNTTAPVVHAGLPIQPDGRATAEQAAGLVFAERTHVGTTACPAVRAFRGTLPSREVGFRFDTHHAKNHAPCGTWTIIAAPEVKGTIMVNAIRPR